jgi:uncharacterized protein YbbC (DUF1343 family)
MQMTRVIFFLLFSSVSLLAKVTLGIDRLARGEYSHLLSNKRIGLITNQTGITSRGEINYAVLKKGGVNITTLFSPEHGIFGNGYAAEKIRDTKIDQIPVFSLHGSHKRPTDAMLSKIDLLIYDIQDIGVRSYTFVSTLFYCMEEAAKRGIPFLILDRPNPMGGVKIDGPMLDWKYRSFLSYINVPYCHGMTVGELASYFNEEYKVGCKLSIIPMQGWNREMLFDKTDLPWIPTSPHMPHSDTPFYYAATGPLGELGLVHIGIGYTLPFRVVGEGYIDANLFSEKLNELQLPGVSFFPCHYRPFYGSKQGKDLHGVQIYIQDPSLFSPYQVGSALMGILKSLYPKEFSQKLSEITPLQKKLFNAVSGTDAIFNTLENERFVTWKLFEIAKRGKEPFLRVREKYLLSEYKTISPQEKH